MNDKHAYCFVQHTNLRVLEVALKMIDDDRNDIFVLFDKKAKIPTSYVEKLKAILRFSELTICYQVTNWAGYSLVSAALMLLEACVEQKKQYQYIHFFHGADLPIKTQDDIHAFFSENSGKEFVEIDRSRMIMAQNKCCYRHWFCDNRYFRKNRVVKLLNFGLVWIQRKLNIKINEDIELFHGSALFLITEDCAKYVLSRRAEIYHRFRYALAPDEVFLQTILMDSGYRDRIQEIEQRVSCNARLIDRTRSESKNSPHTWRKEELNFILGQPRNRCFSRKFEESVDFEIVTNLFSALKSGGIHGKC